MLEGMCGRLMAVLLAGAVLFSGSSMVSASEQVAAQGAQAEVTTYQEAPHVYGKGEAYLAKYAKDEAVRQIILVEQSKEKICEATLYLLIKNGEDAWQEVLSCNAWLGKNGLGKEEEGDVRSPTGDYGFTMALGIKDDPGALIPYTKVTDTMYICGDEGANYNKLVDAEEVEGEAPDESEYLVNNVPFFNYALYLDYNKECEYGKGSGILLHVKGSKGYTYGCIAIDEIEMREIVCSVDENARICVYEG